MSQRIVCARLGQRSPDAWTAIYGSIVTIDDPTPPNASGATGSLLAGGYVRGAVTAGVSSASDSTGIRALRVRTAAGHVVAESERTCDFTRRVPCSDLSAPESFSFDSTAIGDGTHTIEVGVLDSGRNFTAAGTQQVTVDNTAPAAPIHASPSTSSTAASTAAIAWSAPGNQVSPVTTAHIATCGTGGCRTTTQHATNGQGSATVALDAVGTHTVRVWLSDAAGNDAPANAATWTVTRTATPAPTAATGTRAKASPRLALARPTVARDRRTISVRGTVAANVRGRITVQARTRIRGRTRTLTRTTNLRGRRFAVRLRLPAGAWRTARLTVRYPGSTDRLAQRISRSVRRPA